MKVQITRGETFIRETTYYVDASWSEEGGMGHEEYCECKDMKGAFAMLEEAQTKRPDEPWRISVYVSDTEPQKTELKTPIGEPT